jgi:hypothetical protein
MLNALKYFEKSFTIQITERCENEDDNRHKKERKKAYNWHGIDRRQIVDCYSKLCNSVIELFRHECRCLQLNAPTIVLSQFIIQLN